MSKQKTSVADLLSKPIVDSTNLDKTAFKSQKIMTQQAKLMELKYLTGHIFDFATKQITPQAMWACNQLGIKKSGLLDRNLDSFKRETVDGAHPCDDIAKLRHEHYDKRRRNKMRIICAFLKLNPNGFQKSTAKSTDQEEARKQRAQMRQLEQQENIRMSRLKQVNLNIEQNAREEVSEIDKINKRSIRLEKAAALKKAETMLNRQYDQQKVNQRHQSARNTVQQFNDKKTRQSMIDYQEHQRDIVRSLQEKAEQDRFESNQHFTRLNNKSQISHNISKDDITPDVTVAATIVKDAYASFDSDDKKGDIALKKQKTQKAVSPTNKVSKQRPRTAPYCRPNLRQELIEVEKKKVEEVMEAYQFKMEKAGNRLHQKYLERNQANQNSEAKRDKMMSTLRELHDKEEFDHLSNLWGRRETKIKQVREKRRETRELREFNSTKRQEHMENVKTKQKELQTFHNRHRSELEKGIAYKASITERVQDNLNSVVQLHKELRLNKHQEVSENREIDKMLATMNKMRLFARQEQITKNYNDHRERQSVLLKLRHHNAEQLQVLQQDRAMSVKNIKDNIQH